MNFVCRPALVSDAATCAPLVFASGEAEFGYMFGAAADECVAFLRDAFRSRYGRFSYRRHKVAVDARGEVCSVLAVHESRNVVVDDLMFAWQVLRHFGLNRAVGVLIRGARLATELPAPMRGQALIAHCATRPEYRSRGALTALMTNVLAADGTDCRFVLDVRLDNVRARALYSRLGFKVSSKRGMPRHAGLPEALASERMSLSE